MTLKHYSKDIVLISLCHTLLFNECVNFRIHNRLNCLLVPIASKVVLN
jgi:hypothetical protein